MKKFTTILFLSMATLFSYGQNNYSAQVKNMQNFESIGSAFVQIADKENTYSTYATPNGSINISNLIPGKYKITISHIGYRIYQDTVDLTINRSGKVFFLEPTMNYLDAAIISSVRAGDFTPTTFTNLKKEEITQLDQSKDFPFLLNMTPSTVISSDAGNGIGYTGIRVRGIDPTRVNVTVNGIPINDAESQGMYWVNMPDIASSTESVQIQRGVGTSTNGSAAFGASVNIRTADLAQKEFTRMTLGAGSFNTQRLSLEYGTGRLKNNWAFQFRGSLINSDGFIDRANTNLKSANLTAAKYWDNSVFKTNIMLGEERTYQAWNGIPQPKFKGDIAELNRYVSSLYIAGDDLTNLQNSPSKTYNSYTYENEVDQYNQNHYQFFFDHSFSKYLKWNSAAYITTGKGYFEQFKAGEDVADYGIDSIHPTGDTATSADIVRRRWLDNTLIGGLTSLHFQKNKLDLTAGIGFNSYEGDHFGEVIATQYTSYEDINARYYDNSATKTDGNTYLKASYNLRNFIPYIDLQYRLINYTFEGLDDNLNFSNQTVDYGFFNPKVGLIYLHNNATFYGVYAVGNREPVRDDFRNNKPNDWPEHEQLNNIEVGYKYRKGRKQFNINFYDMQYTNQLVLTGAVNDVGEAVRTNIDESYRRGVEIEFQYPIFEKLQVGGNLTFSENKISKFTEYIGEWDEPYDIMSMDYEDTDISFSPNLISAGMLSYKVNPNFTLTSQAKYVGRQFLDNTQTNDRSLDAFTNIDLSLNYQTKDIPGIRQLTIGFYVNNVLNQYYAPNGYTFSGFINSQRQDFNYLYPMAGINWMMKLSMTL
ncbi:TonB-dependent receptor [Bacteroidia bacterium]|nr:TonB-dependent receptor [Bacteroidia bacterium]